MNLRSDAILWLLSLLIAVGAALYQRRTGPTYPIEGTARLGGIEFHYSLERSHGGPGDHPVRIDARHSMTGGYVVWKRHNSDDPVKRMPMRWEGGGLVAYLPHQPPAGKLDYQVVLKLGPEEVVLPPDGSAVIRFKGDVPPGALIPHVVLMFTALLLAMRTGLGALASRKTGALAYVTLALTVVGGLILGTIVQKFAFGALWTGWPFGGDLTDNKTALMTLAWLAALWRLGRRDGERRGRWWAVAATVVTLVVFLIPHSMHGSELDYSALAPEGF